MRGTLRGAVFAMLLGAACTRPPVSGPPGPAFDRQLRELVELRLSSDRRLCPFAIQVVVYNGTVALAGLLPPVRIGRAPQPRPQACSSQRINGSSEGVSSSAAARSSTVS
jgi:hypothetical protein